MNTAPKSTVAKSKVPPEALSDPKMAGFINEPGTEHASMFVEEQIREVAVEFSALGSRLFQVTADVAGTLRAQADDANMYLKALALRVVADNPLTTPLGHTRPVPCAPLVEFAKVSGLDVTTLHQWRVEQARGVCPTFNRCGRCRFLTWTDSPMLFASGGLCPECFDLRCPRALDHENTCGPAPSQESLDRQERLLLLDLDFRNEKYAEIASFAAGMCEHALTIEHDRERGVMDAEFSDGAVVYRARFTAPGSIRWSASIEKNKTIVQMVGGIRPLSWKNAMDFFQANLKEDS